MEKSKINYIIDVLAGVSFVITAITGLIIFLFLRGGNQGITWLNQVGITKHFLVDVHDWSGIVFILLGAVHLILHLEWILYMTKNILSKKDK